MVHAWWQIEKCAGVSDMKRKKKPTKRKTEKKNRRKEKLTKRKTDTVLTVTDDNFEKPTSAQNKFEFADSSLKKWCTKQHDGNLSIMGRAKRKRTRRDKKSRRRLSHQLKNARWAAIRGVTKFELPRASTVRLHLNLEMHTPGVSVLKL